MTPPGQPGLPCFMAWPHQALQVGDIMMGGVGGALSYRVGTMAEFWGLWWDGVGRTVRSPRPNCSNWWGGGGGRC